MSSGFIHVVANVKMSFFSGWMLFYSTFIHILHSPSSVPGHLGCFLTSVIMNNAVMNFGVQIFPDMEIIFCVQDSVYNSFGYIFTSEIARS